MKNKFPHFVLLVGLFVVVVGPLEAQDLKTNEILENHLVALGGRAKLAASKNQIVAGESHFESKMPSRKTSGKALFASNSENLMFVASFASKEYPMEKIGYFDSKVNLPFVTSGTRSPLGSFLLDHDEILKEGLFAGAISSTWLVLRRDISGLKMNLVGRKKVDGLDAYVLSYIPKGLGSEFSIRLFFDAKTFHHLRTEYQRVLSPTENKIGIMGVQGGMRLSLIEKFSDFRKDGDFTLPYSYRAEYKTESNSGSFEYVWGVTVGGYNFDRNLAPDFFAFEK